MEKHEPISRRRMLNMMDIRTTPSGKPMVYSIKFVQKDGKLRFLPQCIITGVNNMNMKQNRVRGVQPCDCSGVVDPGSHPIPVRVFNVIEFNNHPIKQFF